ncbi:MAG: biotin--protein ligase [Desulfovibrionaceae bacterium]
MNTTDPAVFVYWDDAHLWGLMALRALSAWGVPHRLVRGTEIAQGVLRGNPRGLLLAPGGNARGKADALGPEGLAEARDFVHAGGSYLGFCGGAGLALSGGCGLALCPWTRRGFTDRLQHFVSGHVVVSLAQGHALTPAALGEAALVPVWWPAQFAPGDASVTVLARYQAPGPDLWMADLALASLPEGTAGDWEHLYGVRIRPDFLDGRPCVVAGGYGAGRYVLSYAHLETPASPQANAWLAHLLGALLGGSPASDPAPRRPVPAWDPLAEPVRWDDGPLALAREGLTRLIDTGREHFLLFWRTPWLLGWRRGIPGMALNSLLALVCHCQALTPNASARAFWQGTDAEFARDLDLFRRGVTGLLLAERLAMTLAHDGAPLPGLAQQREALFGPPPASGGLYARLLRPLEELFWRLYQDPFPDASRPA